VIRSSGVFYAILLGLINLRFKKYAPLTVYIFSFMLCATVLLEEYKTFNDSSKRHALDGQSRIIMALVITQTLNYTPFLTVLILNPAIFLVPIYFVL
jgi:hypothetical protein